MSNKTKVTLDYDRADFIFGILYDACENKKHPFENNLLPQRRENIPSSIDWGSRDHALFLFTLCYYMRGQIKSETATLKLKKIWEDNPDYFDPDFLKFSEEETSSKIIEDKLFYNGLGFGSKNIAPQWYKNKLKLANHWQSDPRNLFSGVDSYDSALKVLANKGTWKAEKPNGFYGFQEKMVSMLIYFYVEAGIIQPLKFPPPVDFHILRVLFSNEVLKVDSFKPGMEFYYNKSADMAREVTSWWLNKYSKDPIVLSSALWLLSRDSCEKSPGNSSSRGEYNGRKTKVSTSKSSLGKKIKGFEVSCFRCPLKDSCKYDIPSAIYYTKGKLGIRGLRQRVYPVQIKAFD